MASALSITGRAFLVLVSAVLLSHSMKKCNRRCPLQDLVQRSTPGYAIGGLAGGEDKRSFVK